MADNYEAEATTGRRPSAVLLLGGLVALVVALWAFIGPSAWGGFGTFPIGWVLVGGAIAVGLALVAWKPKR